MRGSVSSSDPRPKKTEPYGISLEVGFGQKSPKRAQGSDRS